MYVWGYTMHVWGYTMYVWGYNPAIMRSLIVELYWNVVLIARPLRVTVSHCPASAELTQIKLKQESNADTTFSRTPTGIAVYSKVLGLCLFRHGADRRLGYCYILS